MEPTDPFSGTRYMITDFERSLVKGEEARLGDDWDELCRDEIREVRRKLIWV